MANLLLVEDDASVRQIVMLQLSLVGYDVRAAEDAGQARRMMEEKTPDLAILDIMLPGEDGFSLAETMMERAVPVLFLTAKTAVSDRVRGLRMGAEDYMLKPFEPEELLARVENILRRTRKARTHFVFGALVVDLPSRRVTKGEREVALTALEFDLLAMLVRRSNVALSREALLSGVWGYAYQGETRTVDVHIQRLRGKIGAEYIETVYKYGYRFCGEGEGKTMRKRIALCMVALVLTLLGPGMALVVSRSFALTMERERARALGEEAAIARALTLETAEGNVGRSTASTLQTRYGSKRIDDLFAAKRRDDHGRSASDGAETA